MGLEKSQGQISVFNVGSEDQITVEDIAQTIVKVTGLTNVRFRFTGGIDGGRGWKGDVKNMLLDISKLMSVGWKPKLNSRQALMKTVETIVQDMRY